MTHLFKPLIFLALLSPILATAEIFKWLDENGKVHYGDKPAPDARSAQTVEIKPARPVDQELGKRRQRQQRLLDVFDDDRKKSAAEVSRQEAKQQQAEQKCAHARDRLRRYLDSAGIYKIDSTGERTILSDEARTKAIERVRQKVEHWC